MADGLTPMTRPMKHQRCFDVPDGQPEVTFGFKHVSIPRTQIERRAAQACKQFSATVVPSPSHLESSNPSFVGSVNQQMIGKVMETFTPQKGKTTHTRAFRERCQENLSLFLRRKAAQQRGFISALADLWNCSESKAAKVTYGEANPHWTDFLILYQEFGPEIIDAVLGDDTADLARRKHMLRKLLELVEAEGE